MINRFHFIRGILTEISCEFVSARTVKSTQLIIRVKKESSYLSRLDFEFSYVHGQQLQEKESSKWLPECRLESDAEPLISDLCMRTGSVRHVIRPIRMRYLWSDLSAWKEPFSVGVYGEVFALFQACVGNFDTIPQSKVVGTPYLDSSYVYFKYFAFLSVCRLQNSPYFCVFKYVSSLKFIRLLRVVFSSQQLRE